MTVRFTAETSLDRYTERNDGSIDQDQTISIVVAYSVIRGSGSTCGPADGWGLLVDYTASPTGLVWSTHGSGPGVTYVFTKK